MGSTRHLRCACFWLGFSAMSSSLSNMHSAAREATRLLETMKGGELSVNLQMKLKSYRTMYSTVEYERTGDRSPRNL